jgi:hypothetical protein
LGLAPKKQGADRYSHSRNRIFAVGLDAVDAKALLHPIRINESEVEALTIRSGDAFEAERAQPDCAC